MNVKTIFFFFSTSRNKRFAVYRTPETYNAVNVFVGFACVRARACNVRRRYFRQPKKRVNGTYTIIIQSNACVAPTYIILLWCRVAVVAFVVRISSTSRIVLHYCSINYFITIHGVRVRRLRWDLRLNSESAESRPQLSPTRRISDTRARREEAQMGGVKTKRKILSPSIGSITRERGGLGGGYPRGGRASHRRRHRHRHPAESSWSVSVGSCEKTPHATS